MAKSPNFTMTRPSATLPPEADKFVRGESSQPTAQDANQVPSVQANTATDVPNALTAPGEPVKNSSTGASETTSAAPAEPIKRLTIDIPESLHRAIKVQTAQRGTKIIDEVRELLEEKYRGSGAA